MLSSNELSGNNTAEKVVWNLIQGYPEELLASTSPGYLESIRQARGDYKAKRMKTNEQVFGR